MPTDQKTTLVEQALALPPRDRKKLITVLVESLPVEENNDADFDMWHPAITDALKEMRDDLTSGRVKPLTYEQVFGEKF